LEQFKRHLIMCASFWNLEVGMIPVFFSKGIDLSDSSESSALVIGGTIFEPAGPALANYTIEPPHCHSQLMKNRTIRVS
jgi:hypothetical protein